MLAFCLASSSCYIINDIRDVQADRTHPRKKHRPIASGAVSIPAAGVFSLVLLAGAALACLAAMFADPASGPLPRRALWLAIAIAAYVANTTLYSIRLKHAVVLDVISLATGFVLRVLGGCAAVNVQPSSMLLNVTFFLSMFLAFGKRLGERRTMTAAGAAASSARAVQNVYTDDLLRMAVVVTGVATLITYAGYVEAHGAKIEALGAKYPFGFNLLWLTMLPATYGLMRCIVLLERGTYDDPTELASKDRPLQAAALAFAAVTAAVMFGLHK